MAGGKRAVKRRRGQVDSHSWDAAVEGGLGGLELVKGATSSRLSDEFHDKLHLLLQLVNDLHNNAEDQKTTRIRRVLTEDLSLSSSSTTRIPS